MSQFNNKLKKGLNFQIMERRTGQINVNTENIFPIIRKWLYADQDIFLRELVSNASDAIKKRELLSQMGEIELAAGYEAAIHVTYDSDAQTLTISDNGIGMSEEEIDKYINQIAFSGAMDFMNKYKDKAASDGIIGHFGLGFYSAFMVSDRVEISSLSCQPNARSAHWESEEGTEFVIQAGSRTTVGTDMILHLNEEARESLDATKLREIMDKYCSFMPYPIYFEDIVGDAKQKEEGEARYQERLTDWEKKKAEAEEKGESFEEIEPSPYVHPIAQPINQTEPLWKKSPKDVSDEEYKAFYRDTFNDYREPLFWIHLNMDYPSRVQGILYFPQSENVYETLDGRVKIYNNQVFVADNIKEVIPDFLFLLKGCIDAPDIPLNVSRSFLQNDAYVKKLSEHIVRKVADRLNKLFENERESYEKYWKDIKLFVKYGSLKDEKFYDRVKDSILFETTEGGHQTASEIGEKIYYTHDPEAQVAYVNRALQSGKTVVIMNNDLDNSFMSMFEYKNPGTRFLRLDAAIEGEEGITEHKEVLTTLLQAASENEKLKIDVRALGEAEQPIILSESEESRRMQEMRLQFAQMQGTDMNLDELFPIEQIAIVNTDNPLVSRLVAYANLSHKEEEAKRLARQAYDIARLAHGSLAGADLAAFLSRSTELLNELE